nr:MAG TPA: Rubrerythrin, zinc-substituted, diiron four-helix bundle.75A [Caudoviricetes sp.]
MTCDYWSTGLLKSMVRREGFEPLDFYCLTCGFISDIYHIYPNTCSVACSNTYLILSKFHGIA